MNDTANKVIVAASLLTVALYFGTKLDFHSESEVAPPVDAVEKSESLAISPTASSVAAGVMPHGASQPAKEKLDHSKSEEVERLQKTGRPVDAFEAYKIIEACLHSRTVSMQMSMAVMPATKEWMAKVPKPEVACGDISPGQISSRRNHLEVAARAGIPGSAIAYLTGC